MDLPGLPLTPAASSKGYPIPARLGHDNVDVTARYYTFKQYPEVQNGSTSCYCQASPQAIQSGRMSRQRQRAEVSSTQKGNKHYFRFETNNGARKQWVLWEKSLEN